MNTDGLLRVLLLGVVLAAGSVPFKAAHAAAFQPEQASELRDWLLERCRERAAAGDFAELTRLHERMLKEGLATEFDRLALRPVLRSLVAEDAEVRGAAAELAHHLTGWGFSETRKTLTHEERDSLVAALDDDSEFVAAVAVLYLGRAGCEADEAVPRILSLARSPDSYLRREASWSLALMARGSAVAADAVVRGCREGPEEARVSVIGAAGLAGAGGARFVQTLHELLEDPSDEVAGSAAVALARADSSPRTGGAIAAQLRVDRASVDRFLSALYSMRYRDPAVVPDVVQALLDDPDTNGTWGGPLLGDIGAGAADALPALRAIADDPEVHVRARAYAGGAVRKIEDDLGEDPLPQWPSELSNLALIEQLATIRDGAYGDRDGYGQPLDPPPPWTITAARALRERCEQNRLSAEEWRALVRQIIDDPETEQIFERTRETGRFWSYYGGLLREADKRGMISAEDRERLDSRSRLRLELPEEWPAGVPVRGRVWVQHWQGDHGRYTFFDAEGNTIHSGEDDPVIGAHYAWHPVTDFLEPVTPALGAGEEAQIHAQIEFREDDGWRVVRRYDTPLDTTIRGTIDDYVRPAGSAAIAEALATKLAPRLHLDQDRGTVQAEHYPGRIVSVIVAEGHPTIALMVEAWRGETLVAQGDAWWWAEDPDRYFDGRFVRKRVLLKVLEPDALQDWWEADEWSLRLISHPETALRNADQPSYWDGEVIIPVRPE